MDDHRFNEIDIMVSDSGLNYNPTSGRFEATVGSDAENNLDFEWSDALSMLPEELEEDEFREYVSMKDQKADDEFHEQEAHRIMEELEKKEDEPNE